jgi:hypothetical protein
LIVLFIFIYRQVMMSRVNIIPGEKYGKLTIISEAGRNPKGNIMWICRCDCGRTVEYHGSQLKKGKAVTCQKCAYGYYDFIGDTVICRLPDNVTFLIDKEDYPLVSQYPWRLTTSGYLTAYIRGKKTRLHYLLMPRMPGKLCDHMNRDKMDNRKCNLRYATSSENLFNKSIQSNNTTGYIGVSKCINSDRYRAYINFHKKRICLGVFDDPKKAALARDNAARLYHGEFAIFNFEQGECDYA